MRFPRLVWWLLALGLGLAACSDSGKLAVQGVAAPSKAVEATPTPAPTVRKVALVMKTLTNPFFVEMERGARRAEKELGLELLVKTASQETSIEQQIQIVEELIRMKVEAIVIAPGDSQRLVPVLKAAQDAGIPIINIDNRLDPEALKKHGLIRVPFVSVDNAKAAYESARFIARQVSKPTQAVILEGIRSADNARQRKEGAERAFKENPLIRIVAMETANWKIDEGYEVSRKLFMAHPDITLVFCANDMMALGALKYLKEAGKQGVKVAAYDALDEARAAVKAGTLAVTVDQQAAEQGYRGILLAHRALEGESLPEVTLIDTRLVTVEAVK
ncbi:sugar ABC transporter substrate-binding protein [Hyalangium minutum]|uniref:Ribose ABC transport system, periplasmic ribose-binding protein RbsB n=1 Tax=Hyalangium minutum TaxID=394096 RepID=A0A085VZ04_9BACT|nr:sugar ABC transporter substrate-binding protein [Hyalangium minutum]KFE58429.1 Ribose ABC transport system, periplasmic ribose-binding protein RbsB [Hyalangium minutum]KFE60667.1 Ribose ABC transport system, periplasmic ribose-binding protein RbsB [Hyalangium minutum]